MISGINCRANVSEAATIGPNIEELHGAAAIDLSPFPNQQRQQLDANLRVAFKSEGPICSADWRGKLSYIESIAHHRTCVRFIRCVGHRLRARFENVVEADGELSAELLPTDPDIKSMIEHEWTW